MQQILHTHHNGAHVHVPFFQVSISILSQIITHPSPTGQHSKTEDYSLMRYIPEMKVGGPYTCGSPDDNVCIFSQLFQEVPTPSKCPGVLTWDFKVIT